MSTLRFGVFDEFKGGRTLLLWGGRDAIAALRTVFRELAGGTSRATALHETGWAEGVRSTRLFLGLAESNAEQALQLSQTNGATSVTWNGTSSEFGGYADLIAPLLDPECTSGHQYLEANRNCAFRIMVSKGEYPDDLN
jgi:hypothetical protein